MDEQAAEYADLVGSFVESVHDEETDAMIEYQLIWEGGDLGVALTPIEGESVGVVVSRVTGKGFPFGIKNVGAGDVLLSINLCDTTKLALDQVVALLQECDLPATLRFKKLSPDLDHMPPPLPPRASNIIVTSDTPTSPMGSQRPLPSAHRASVASNASNRLSQKSVVSMNAYAQPQQRNGPRFSTASSTRSSMQQVPGRMSVALQPGSRPSDMSHGRSSDALVSPPKPAPQRQSSQSPINKPEPQPKPVTVPVPTAKPTTPKPTTKSPAPSPPKPQAPAPQTVVMDELPSPSPVQKRASSKELQFAKGAPATRAPPPPAPVHVEPMPTPASPKRVKTPRAAAPAPAPVPVPVPVPVDDRSSHESYASSLGRDSWRSSEEDIDDARDRIVASVPPPSLARGASIEGEQMQRDKAQSVAMLGHFSTETDGIPLLPEESAMGVIASVDGVPQAEDFFESDEDVSPIGHAVQPAAMPRGSSRPLLSPPRGSVRLTMDGGAEPMMKSQPIGALHELCAKGNLRGAMQHIKVNGPDGLIQREANHGQTCLHLAVKSGNLQLAKHICEQYEPADELINCEDDKGNTALHFAATKTPGMVHLLLESGASANVKNARKLTPLIISVITSKDDAIIIPRMLLKFGANPNDMHDSHTVIHTAIGMGLLHIAGALVHAGAKMDVEDADGKSVYDKLGKKSIRFLISHIHFPPTYINEKERQDCMVCHKKIKFGHRKNNCTHCGRLSCSECCSLGVEMYKFPLGFPGRIRRGAGVRDLKKVCKTCFGVFKERGDTPQKEENRFVNRVIGVEWDEVNPNKLQGYRAAGRRGEKEN